MNLNLTTYIRELLSKHDCVILPGFGGLITHYKEADIDHVQGYIFPPSKEISFNQELKLNDGLLINYVARKAHISYAEAKNEIENLVKGFNEQLANKEILALPEIGKLYFDVENKLQFIPEDTNLLRNSFGLPQVQFYPILRAETVQEKSAIIEAAKIEEPIKKLVPKKQNKGASAGLIAASLIFLVALSLVIYNIFGINQANQLAKVEDDKRFDEPTVIDEPSYVQEENAGFHFFLDSNKENVSTPTIEEKIEEPKKEEIKEIAVEEEIKKEKEEEKVVEESPKKATTKATLIIIGHFGKKDNATRLKSKIEKDGYEVVLGRKGSLHRVSIRVEDTNKVKQTLQKAKAKYSKSAWVLK